MPPASLTAISALLSAESVTAHGAVLHALNAPLTVAPWSVMMSDTGGDKQSRAVLPPYRADASGGVWRITPADRRSGGWGGASATCIDLHEERYGCCDESCRHVPSRKSHRLWDKMDQVRFLETFLVGAAPYVASQVSADKRTVQQVTSRFASARVQS